MTSFRAAAIPGQGRGFLVRRGDVALLFDPTGSGETDRALIDLAGSVSSAPPDERGRLLGRRLLGLLAGLGGDELPDLGAVAVTSDGIAVIVHGGFVASWSSSRGAEDLSARAALSGWVDRIIPDPVEELRLARRDDHDDAVPPFCDLRDGVVVADAVVLDHWRSREEGAEEQDDAAASDPDGDARVSPPSPDARGESVTTAPSVPRGVTRVAPARPPARTASEAAADEAPAGAGGSPTGAAAAVETPGVVIFDLGRSPGARDRLPLSSKPASPQEGALGAEDAAVDGILCPRGHFNHPEIAYCNICGIGFNQVSHVLVSGPRPPLGVLVLDDGATFAVDADYLIGREPAGHPEVRSGKLRPLPLDDPSQSVSRVHAQIITRGWEVLALDRGSANGTRVMTPRDSVWRRLAPGEEQRLPSGSRLSLGPRSMVFQSHHLPASTA